MSQNEPARLENEDLSSREALQARVEELEREIAALRKREQERPEGALGLPPFELKALRLLRHGWGEGWALRPSPPRRAWMDAQPRAYQCLPLTVANQWGWQVLCPTDLAVTWDGSPGKVGLKVEIDPRFAPAIKSQFGEGIVTFSPPWLFRTPKGWDLYAKGPSNRWKPNCVPLEGVIETWWLSYTFTLNWKLVEPGTVWFARGESLGQLVPVPHDTFRGSTARERPILREEPETGRELLRWRAERRRIADEPVNTHRLYLKADAIPEHITKVGVPPVEPI